ncbi:MAG: Gx transporter family protein [Candidatus Heteroscillospira sp.]|jgi:heptaprenyl diphosphate synthase
MKANRLTRLALLTTIALIIFTAEAQIPVPVPIPGVKLGLANVVTVYAAFTMLPGETMMILFVRVFLGSLFTGNMLAMLYSLGGGALCLLVTLPLTKILTRHQMWIASAAGGVFHNLGQLIVAALVMKTLAVFAYLPPLLISGVITGCFTGLAAQSVTDRLSKK